MQRFLLLGVLVLAVAAASFYATLRLLPRPSPAPTGAAVVVQQSGATRCEVQFTPERCPAHPEHGPFDARHTLDDTWDNANTNVERCMKRAADYFNYCKSSGPVTARFFRGSFEVQSATSKP